MAGPHPSGPLSLRVESEAPGPSTSRGCLLAKRSLWHSFALRGAFIVCPGPASVSAPGARTRRLPPCLTPLLSPCRLGTSRAAREEGVFPVSFVHILSD